MIVLLAYMPKRCNAVFDALAPISSTIAVTSSVQLCVCVRESLQSSPFSITAVAGTPGVPGGSARALAADDCGQTPSEQSGRGQLGG